MTAYGHYANPHIFLDPLPNPLGLLRPVGRASYKTHYGADENEPHGCMEDTHVHILAYIETWEDDSWAPKIYWLNGLLGIGNTSIAHTFCRRLDVLEKLGVSFICSRSGLMDPTRIIPTFANMLLNLILTSDRK